MNLHGGPTCEKWFPHAYLTLHSLDGTNMQEGLDIWRLYTPASTNLTPGIFYTRIQAAGCHI